MGTDKFMTFHRVLMQNETQSALSNIWTLVTNSIFSDDNNHVMSYVRGNFPPPASKKMVTYGGLLVYSF